MNKDRVEELAMLEKWSLQDKNNRYTNISGGRFMFLLAPAESQGRSVQQMKSNKVAFKLFQNIHAAIRYEEFNPLLVLKIGDNRQISRHSKASMRIITADNDLGVNIAMTPNYNFAHSKNYVREVAYTTVTIQALNIETGETKNFDKWMNAIPFFIANYKTIEISLEVR